MAIRIAPDTIPPFLMAGFRWTAAGRSSSRPSPHAASRRPLRDRGPRSRWASVARFRHLRHVGAELIVPSGLAAALVGDAVLMVGIEAMRQDRERLPPGTWRSRVGSQMVPSWGCRSISARARVSRGRPLYAARVLGAGRSVPPLDGAARKKTCDDGIQMLFETGFTGAWCGSTVEGRGDQPRTAERRSTSSSSTGIAGFSAFAYALKHLPVATVSLYAYVNPIIAVILGTLLLGEPFTVRMALAAGLIFAGIGLVRSPRLSFERQTRSGAPAP
jgi:hypothetical protein